MEPSVSKLAFLPHFTVTLCCPAEKSQDLAKFTQDVSTQSGLFHAGVATLKPGVSSGITGIKQKPKSTDRPKWFLITFGLQTDP